MACTTLILQSQNWKAGVVFIPLAFKLAWL
jgi:hypothetical protein